MSWGSSNNEIPHHEHLEATMIDQITNLDHGTTLMLASPKQEKVANSMAWQPKMVLSHHSTPMENHEAMCRDGTMPRLEEVNDSRLTNNKTYSGDRKSEFGQDELDDSKKDENVLEIQTQILQKETPANDTTKT